MQFHALRCPLAVAPLLLLVLAAAPACGDDSPLAPSDVAPGGASSDAAPDLAAPASGPLADSAVLAIAGAASFDGEAGQVAAPGVVQDFAASPGSASLSLSWAAPAGATVYHLNWWKTNDAHRDSKTVTTTIHTLSGLDAVEYTLGIRAGAGSGGSIAWGPWAPQIAATPNTSGGLAAPGAVGSPQATPGPSTLTFSWTAPAGTATVYHYNWWKAGGLAKESETTTSTSVEIGSLDAVEYHLAVRAGNDGHVSGGPTAWGPWSPQISATPQTQAGHSAPGAVADFTVTGGAKNLHLKWRADADATVWHYNYWVSGSSARHSRMSRRRGSLHVDGLEPGVYVVSIRAGNDGRASGPAAQDTAWGPWSAQVSASANTLPVVTLEHGSWYHDPPPGNPLSGPHAVYWPVCEGSDMVGPVKGNSSYSVKVTGATGDYNGRVDLVRRAVRADDRVSGYTNPLGYRNPDGRFILPRFVHLSHALRSAGYNLHPAAGREDSDNFNGVLAVDHILRHERNRRELDVTTTAYFRIVDDEYADEYDVCEGRRDLPLLGAPKRAIELTAVGGGQLPAISPLCEGDSTSTVPFVVKNNEAATTIQFVVWPPADNTYHPLGADAARVPVSTSPAHVPAARTVSIFGRTVERVNPDGDLNRIQLPPGLKPVSVPPGGSATVTIGPIDDNGDWVNGVAAFRVTEVQGNATAYHGVYASDPNRHIGTVYVREVDLNSDEPQVCAGRQRPTITIKPIDGSDGANWTVDGGFPWNSSAQTPSVTIPEGGHRDFCVGIQGASGAPGYTYLLWKREGLNGGADDPSIRITHPVGTWLPSGWGTSGAYSLSWANPTTPSYCGGNGYMWPVRVEAAEDLDSVSGSTTILFGGPSDMISSPPAGPGKGYGPAGTLRLLLKTVDNDAGGG